MDNITLEIRSPENFTMKHVILMNLLSVGPSFAAGALLGVGGVGSVAVPLLGPYVRPLPLLLSPFIGALGLSLLAFYLAPLLFNVNYYVRDLVRRYGRTQPAASHVCQLSTVPRLCRGARGFLEDADDVGLLNLSGSEMSFTGDHVDLRIPYSSIASVTRHNVGWRGLWFLYGSKIRIEIENAQGYGSFELAERQCNTVASSKRLSIGIYRVLQEKVHGA